jgi:adenosine deaminase
VIPNFIELPKIELHLHLDCSLSFDVVQQINPSISFEHYQESFIAPAKCTDLADYISRAVKGFELMQTAEELRLVTLDLFQQLKQDNVIYAEIRFAPLLHLLKGLTAQEVVQTVNDAASEGMEKTGVQAGIILCTLRHFNEDQSMQTVQLVHQFSGTNIVGFDIAGDEAGFPIDEHFKAFAYAKTHGLPVTAHAGEAKGAGSVWETLEHFHPKRIGHGVRSVEDIALLNHLKTANIHLEVCPTSNVQTNLTENMASHPADEIYRSGVSMSINTDARTISDTTLAKEYKLLSEHFDWEKNHFLRCNLEAIEHAFLPAEKKAALREKINSAYL